MSSGGVGKLAYFPEPYPGELLYSLLSRYARHMHARTAAFIGEELFGYEPIVPTIAVPNRLGTLASRIPVEAGLTVERLIEHHTLFPYYRAFSDPERSRAVRDGMIGDGKTVSSIAHGNEWVPRVRTLRFCEDCLEAMIAEHNEGHWRRVHQLPGVLVCVDHGRVLRESTVTPGGRSRVFRPATRATCPVGARPLLTDLTDDQVGLLAGIAAESAAILDGTDGRDRDSLAWRRDFTDLCASRGLRHGDDRIRRDGVRQAVVGHLGFLRPMWPKLFDGDACGSWINRAIHPDRRVIDPVLTMLAERAVQRMEPAADVGRPFGVGPWPCLNPLSGHRGEFLIERVRVTNQNGWRSGLFMCRCGYAYRRPAFPDGRIGSPRMSTYGPSLVELLRESLSIGRGFNATCRIAEMSGTTMRRLAPKLGFTDWPDGRRGRRGGTGPSSTGAGAEHPVADAAGRQSHSAPAGQPRENHEKVGSHGIKKVAAPGLWSGDCEESLSAGKHYIRMDGTVATSPKTGHGRTSPEQPCPKA